MTTGLFRAVVLGGLMAIAAPAAAQESRARHDERREQWQKVDQVFEAMALRPGAVVADLGAGDGFFTVRLSKAVGPQGRVYAVDIGAQPLRRLRARIADDGLTNVEVIEGAVDDPKLPAGALDAVLIVNAYHEMHAYKDILAKVKAALKPDGRLVIIEPIAASRRDQARDEQTRSHQIGVDFVRQETREAGFRQVLLQDPFTSRPHDEMWLLVLSPARLQTNTPSTPPAPNEDWKAPELRITPEEFKRLAKAGDVLVLDVRDPQSYAQGHLPGAVLMTPEELSTPQGSGKLKGEKRLIVTYCS